MKLYWFQLFFFLLVLAAVIVSFVFYSIGIREFPQVPDFIFQQWFIIGSLVIYTLGFAIVIYTYGPKLINFGFIVTSLVLLISVVFLYINMYYNLNYNPKLYSSIQFFSFNIVINSIILMVNIIFNSKSYILGVICIIPLLLAGLYYLYIASIISKSSKN